MSLGILPNTFLPVHLWTDILEPEAEKQLRSVARVPILFHHVAVMPDVHFGIGATVGSVLASKNGVIPAAVGVDIGCGVCIVKLPITKEWFLEQNRTLIIRNRIEKEIPVGFNQYKPEKVSSEVEDWASKNLKSSKIKAPLKRNILEKALLQIGTLGGGNHFIEICHDEEGNCWVMLHSGSRHIGKQIADYYIKLAKTQLKKSGRLAKLPDPNLAYFVEGTSGFRDYMQDLFWAQEYAYFNRQEMMRRILKEIAAAAWTGKGKAPELIVKERMDCHHNYVSRESHYGHQVYVTRKGALSAKKNESGVIPGSMGASSYIVKGKGNPESFCSCAHGAGRAMSRREAKRRFNVADLAFQTEGVECRKDKGVLDEIPSAYKNIDSVMANQKDLVEISHRLKQLICVKG